MVEVTDDLEEATKGQTDRSKWFARVYILSLIVSIIAGFIGFIHLGIIEINVTMNANLNIGWIIELLVFSLSVLLVLFTSGMVLKATGGKVLGAVISTIAKIADQYELDPSGIQKDE